MIGSQAWTLPLSGLGQISQSSESPCPHVLSPPAPEPRNKVDNHILGLDAQRHRGDRASNARGEAAAVGVVGAPNTGWGHQSPWSAPGGAACGRQRGHDLHVRRRPPAGGTATLSNLGAGNLQGRRPGTGSSGGNCAGLSLPAPRGRKLALPLGVACLPISPACGRCMDTGYSPRISDHGDRDHRLDRGDGPDRRLRPMGRPRHFAGGQGDRQARPRRPSRSRGRLGRRSANGRLPTES